MKTFFTLVLSCIAIWASAQTTPSAFHFNTAVSFNPVVLAATDNTAMPGAEYRLPHRLAVVLDAGYIFASYYFRDGVLKGVSGVALRPGLKWYTKSGKGFLQLQLSYKQVGYKLEDWLGKACVNGVASYEQFQEFTYRKKAFSVNALAGEFFRLSDGVLLELYGGAGVKIKNQGPAERAACYRNTNEIGSTFREHVVTSNVPLGIKLLVVIN